MQLLNIFNITINKNNHQKTRMNPNMQKTKNGVFDVIKKYIDNIYIYIYQK